MLIIGWDLHARYRETALLDTATGEVVTRRLEHEKGEASDSSANDANVGIDILIERWY